MRRTSSALALLLAFPACGSRSAAAPSSQPSAAPAFTASWRTHVAVPEHALPPSVDRPDAECRRDDWAAARADALDVNADGADDFIVWDPCTPGMVTVWVAEGDGLTPVLITSADSLAPTAEVRENWVVLESAVDGEVVRFAMSERGVYARVE